MNLKWESYINNVNRFVFIINAIMSICDLMLLLKKQLKKKLYKLNLMLKKYLLKVGQ